MEQRLEQRDYEASVFRDRAILGVAGAVLGISLIMFNASISQS